MIRKLINLFFVVFRLVIRLPLHILYFVSGFITRDPLLWAFGAWEGRRYSDNTSYLFEYVNGKVPDVRCIWLTRDKRIVDDLNGRGYRAYIAGSISGYLANARAGRIFITHGLMDVNQYACRGVVVASLTHATLPIKKMGLDHIRSLPPAKRIYNRLDQPYEYIRKDYAFASSKGAAVIVSSSLNVPMNRVIVTGVPREDFLLAASGAGGTPESKKSIYYIPTFRNDPAFDIFGFGFDPRALDGFLGKTGRTLIFRPHPFESAKYKDSLKGMKNVTLDLSEDPYPLLKKAEILITDYSSICYDYLLLDRPMIFAAFDHAGYMREREFYYDYDEMTPGAKAKDWSELIARLGDITAGRDEWRAARAKMADFVFDFKDRGSCGRIVDFMLKLK